MNGGERQLADVRAGDVILGAGTSLQWAGYPLFAAQNIAAGAELVSTNGQTLTVESVAVGSYNGKIGDVIVKNVSPPPDLPPHLIGVEGIVAGDFMLEQGG